MAYGLGSKGNPFYPRKYNARELASISAFDQRDAVEELELWHQVWDDTVMETLDYVAATAAADKAIHFRTPSRAIDHQARAALAQQGLYAPGSIIQWNPYQGAKKKVNGRDWMYVSNEWISLPPPPPPPPRTMLTFRG